MAMTMSGTYGMRAEMNVTPMIDVLLVLIVIFMLVCPLAPSGLPALVPQPAQTETPERPGDLVLTVHADGTVQLNQEAFDLAGLQSRLAELFKLRGDSVIFVRGEGNLEFRQIAQVIDAARGAGMMRVALMTGPEAL